MGEQAETTRHPHSILVDNAVSNVGIIGAGPVVPIGIGVGGGVHIVAIEAAGKFVVISKAKVQTLILGIFSLAHYHVPPAGAVPPGPGHQGKRFISQVNSAPSIHIIIAAIEQRGLVDAAGDAAGGAGIPGAGALALAGDVYDVSKALPGEAGAGRFVEGQVQSQDIGLV